ncbi:MAG: glycosyltransferase family 2 protein [Gemmatimonadales bacterium]
MTPRLDAGGPFVSIVVPCRNEVGYIRPMLDSLLANAYPRDRLEVVIVDGMSDDGTRAVLAEYASRYSMIQVLDNPKRTTPHALNLGIARARGGIIMRMDAHATYPSNYVADLVAGMERTGADTVGAAWRTQPGNGTIIARAIAAALAHPFGIGNARYRLGTDRLRDVDTLQCACYRRAVFERLGLFDEDLLRSQDSEFTFRLLRAGGRAVLVPGVVVNYYTRESLRKLWRMFFQYGYFKPLVALKVGAVMTARQVVPTLFITSVGLATLLAPVSGAARVLLALLLGAYLTADLLAAAIVARRRGAFVGLASLLVFPVIHLAFGIAYWRGTVDFVIRRRREVRAVSLSR